MLAFIASRGRLKPVDLAAPRLRPGWELIRVRMGGICNTDVEILRGYHDFRGVFGHEFVGEVVAVRGVSAAAKRRWLNQRVAGEINVSWFAYGHQPVSSFWRRGLG